MIISIQKSLIGLTSLGIIAASDSCSTRKNVQTGPNIIYILADDLGYGDLGCYGQEKIETPNIDRLAANGMLFTQFYVGSPVSAPSRAELLTGMNSGKSQVRGNDEWIDRGDVWNYRAMLADSSLEGQRPLASGTYTIGRMLQSAGYKTALVGKWGLGAPQTDGVPNKQGFDFFYGYNCQRMAHTYFPVNLWKNDRRVHLNNDTIAPHTPLPEGADPYDLKNYAPYLLNDYAPELMFREITRFVNENKNNPFFLEWATTIPHVPLQAPQRWVDHYVNKFGDEKPHLGSIKRGAYFPCRYPNATYAAMISFFDEQVGKLVQQLKDLGIYENTLIILTSDNGPTGESALWFKSASPFRSDPEYMKANVNEGGIRVPMIAAWPGVVKQGSVSDHVSANYDVMATLAELTGIKLPVETSGISFLPTLKGKKQKEHEYMYWEFPERGGQMAVRIGNLKALRKQMHNGNLKWELYDLEKDPQERNDISGTHPEILKKVNEIIAIEHTVSQNNNWRYKVLGD